MNRKKFKSFSFSDDLQLGQLSSFQVLKKSESILLSQFQKLYEANYKSIFLKNINNAFNLENFSNFKIAYLLKTLNFIFDEKNELQKIKQLFEIINCSNLSLLKENIFFHLLAILKINPTYSFFNDERKNMIGKEFLEQYNDVNKYTTFIHKEFILFFLNFRSNYINKRKDIPKKYSFTPKINKCFLKMKKCISERNLLRIEDRTLLDQQSLFKKIHSFKLNRLYQDIDIDRRPNNLNSKEEMSNSFAHITKEKLKKFKNVKNTISRLTIDLTLLKEQKNLEEKKLYVDQVKTRILARKENYFKGLGDSNSKNHFRSFTNVSISQESNMKSIGSIIPNKEKLNKSVKNPGKQSYFHNTDINKNGFEKTILKENTLERNDLQSTYDQLPISSNEKILFSKLSKSIYN